jgi:hypothetical protein
MNELPRAYTLSFEEYDRCLHVRVSADSLTLKQSEMYLREIAEECRKRRVVRLLVERDISKTLSNANAYQIVSTFAEIVPPGFKTAFVESDHGSRQRFKFGVRMARENDMDVAVFSSVVEANEWLLERGEDVDQPIGSL